MTVTLVDVTGSWMLVTDPGSGTATTGHDNP